MSTAKQRESVYRVSPSPFTAGDCKIVILRYCVGRARSSLRAWALLSSLCFGFSLSLLLSPSLFPSSSREVVAHCAERCLHALRAVLPAAFRSRCSVLNGKEKNTQQTKTSSAKSAIHKRTSTHTHARTPSGAIPLAV